MPAALKRRKASRRPVETGTRRVTRLRDTIFRLFQPPAFRDPRQLRALDVFSTSIYLKRPA